jgi:tetratricopeptide (TPR) repeat protein
MKVIRLLMPVFCILLLSSCQATKETSLPLPQDLLSDVALEGTYVNPETIEQIFVLPKATKIELSRILTTTQSIEERTTEALELIFSYAKDGLIYDNMATRTASETIAAGKANCLSLSILVYSMAKELGMTANFQEVKIPEYWTSAYNQTWLNGHINVRLKQHRVSKEFSGIVVLGNDYVVDFDPYSEKQQFPVKNIGTQRVVSMFYNNKAAVAFARKDYAKAFSYYKAAAQIDPNFAVTWSNLGVLFRVNSMHDLAEKSYRHSLALNPVSTNTLANLSILYRQVGKISEAETLEKQVLATRRNNPYFYLMLGDEAYSQQKYHNAINQYQKSVNLKSKNHEAYFGLAKSYLALHDAEQARRYLKKAHRTAPSEDEQDKYGHKLSILNQVVKVW